MRFSTPQECKAAAEKFAADLYRRHIESGNDLNPYCTDGARAEFDRAFTDMPRRTWDINPDFDYRYQLGRAVAELVKREIV